MAGTDAGNQLADTLATAIVTGDYNKAKIVALSAVLGCVFEMARNLLKNRSKLGMV